MCTNFEDYRASALSVLPDSLALAVSQLVTLITPEHTTPFIHHFVFMASLLIPGDRDYQYNYEINAEKTIKALDANPSTSAKSSAFLAILPPTARSRV